MNLNPATKVFDGDYEIIFSDSFNIYESTIKITEIAGYTFIITFDKKIFDSSALLEAKSVSETKTVNITLKNFRNDLGAANTEKLPVLDLNDGRKVFLSIYGKSLNQQSEFMHVTVNFYVR